jgi:tetratricopeptide (TPR) repeat protein
MLMRLVAFNLSRAQSDPVISQEEVGSFIHTLAFALQLPDAWPMTRDLLLILAPKMEQAGYRDEWKAYLEMGIHQSLTFNDSEAEAALRLHLGVLLQHLGRLDDAQRQFEHALSHYKSVADLYNQVHALNSLAYLSQLRGQLGEAEGLANSALGLLDEPSSEHGFSYYVLGIVAYNRNVFGAASAYFQKALTLWKRTDDKRAIARGLTSSGAVLRSLNMNEEAIALYREAIELFESIQDPLGLALARMNLGNLLLGVDRPNEALELYLHAEQVFRRTHDVLHLAALSNNLGLAYAALWNWGAAIAAYTLSIELWCKVGNHLAQADTMDSLGVIYLNEGSYRTAMELFEAALELLDQVGDNVRHTGLLDIVTCHLKEAVSLSESPGEYSKGYLQPRTIDAF